VRGLYGTYTQRWAEENRHAFENLSELDFAAGVIDCSDIAPEHFTRVSEKKVIHTKVIEKSEAKQAVLDFAQSGNTRG
jgi:hypothetical protein